MTHEWSEFRHELIPYKRAHVTTWYLITYSAFLWLFSFMSCLWWNEVLFQKKKTLYNLPVVVAFSSWTLFSFINFLIQTTHLDSENARSFKSSTDLPTLYLIKKCVKVIQNNKVLLIHFRCILYNESTTHFYFEHYNKC